MSNASSTTPALNDTPVQTAGKYMVLLAAFMGWMFDGVEMGLFSLVARPAMRHLLGPQHAGEEGMWVTGGMAAFLLGAAVGGIIFGWLGDRVGRVKAMIFSVLTYSLCSALGGFVMAPWQLVAVRFLGALGMGGEWALGVALVMEVWPASKRPLLAGLIGIAGNVGFVMVAALGLVLTTFVGQLRWLFNAISLPQTWTDALLASSAWRLLFILGAVPALLTLIIQIFVPESKKWQHAAATTPRNKLSDIFTGGLASRTILGSLLGGISLMGTWASVQMIPSWTRTLPSAQFDPNHAAAIAQILSGLGACVGGMAAAQFAQLTSRRVGYFALSLTSLLTCLYLFSAKLPYGNGFLMWVFIVGGVTAGFFGWLPLYLPELFPTRVRATGQGFAYNIGRVLAAAGSVFSGQLLTLFHNDYAQMCFWMSLIYLPGIIVIWFCPETKNKPLPE